MSVIKAALFDLDGVIVDTAKYHYMAWKWLADVNDIYFDIEINERLKGVSRMSSLEIILEKSNKSYTQEEKEKMCETKNNWYLEMVETITPKDVLAGVTALLKEIRAENMKTAICSASKSAALIIEKLELKEYFDEILGGADVKKPKPDPEIFVLASERFGFETTECIVFEDAYAGIEAAKKAGMFTVGIGNKEILTNADIVYEGMDKVIFQEIKRIYGGQQ